MPAISKLRDGTEGISFLIKQKVGEKQTEDGLAVVLTLNCLWYLYGQTKTTAEKSAVAFILVDPKGIEPSNLTDANRALSQVVR